MEALLGFPYSLLAALVPIFLYRPNFNRRYWLVGMFIASLAFLFLPEKARIAAFLPGGTALIFFVSGIWVVALNPQSSIFKLLNMPLPTRRELKAEIEKIPDTEGRVQKYLALTIQLKKIWQKRDLFLTGYNSALLLVFSIAMTAMSYGTIILESLRGQGFRNFLAESLVQFKIPDQDLGTIVQRVQEFGPAIFFVLNFLSLLCLGMLLRALSRWRFKQNIVQGHMSLFRIPDNWVWGLIVFAGVLVLGPKQEGASILNLVVQNGVLILLALYALQGIGITALFFEVRLMPTHWLILAIVLVWPYIPGSLFTVGGIFAILGLMEVWLSLRKRSLRYVGDSKID